MFTLSRRRFDSFDECSPGEVKDRAREDARTDLLPWFGDVEVENKFVGFLRVPIG